MTRPILVLVHSPVLGPTSVHPTARALSGLGWVCLAPSLTDAGTIDEHVDAAAAGVPDGAMLIAHSGAGPLVPAIAARAARRIAGAVFVDARIPAAQGSTALAEPTMLDFLAERAVDGLVPPWSQWWGDAAFAALVPDPELADAMRAEMRPLPIEFFRSQVAVPSSWPDHPCAYLQLSDAYGGEASEARVRRWPVARHDGAHLDLATRPEPTAGALDRLLRQMP